MFWNPPCFTMLRHFILSFIKKKVWWRSDDTDWNALIASNKPIISSTSWILFATSTRTNLWAWQWMYGQGFCAYALIFFWKKLQTSLTLHHKTDWHILKYALRRRGGAVSLCARKMICGPYKRLLRQCQMTKHIW